MEFKETDDYIKTWFPALYREGTRSTKYKYTNEKPKLKPKLRIICFPPAGCAEDMFSTEGTGERAKKSPLLEWARRSEADVLAVQYPGRNNRKKEKFVTSIKDIVKPLHSALRKYCNDDSVPYVIVAHSVGTWIACELLHLIRADNKEGNKGTRSSMFKLPEQVFFSSFPPPSMPMEERPWRVNKDLSEEEFKTECRRWNINEIVFAELWSVYHPMLRADFTLFDQYEYQHGDESKFTWPLTVFSAKNDDMITSTMCQLWKEQTTELFEFFEVDGNHMFPLDKEQKSDWLDKIAKGLDDVMEVIELKFEYSGISY